MSDISPLILLIKRFEGCYLKPYLCPAGVWTCGWGSTGVDVIPGERWTQAYADERMMRDAEHFIKATKLLCPDLTGQSLCAIADFAYNLGIGRLRASTLRKRVNEGNLHASRIELLRWTRAGGKVLRGLVLRRQAEAALLDF